MGPVQRPLEHESLPLAEQLPPIVATTHHARKRASSPLKSRPNPSPTASTAPLATPPPAKRRATVTAKEALVSKPINMDIQPHTPSDELGTLVNKLSSHLAKAESWEQFVNEVHGPPHLRPNLDRHEHPAGALLHQYQLHGVPVLMAGEPPSPADLDAKIERGAHQSARLHGPFIRQEMSEFIKSGYWVVLPYSQVRDLPDLHLSPLGVKEERDRRPRLVADHTFYGENDLTCPTAPPESMQFGGTLYRILHRVHHADPKYGPVHLAKFDLKDGFYRLHLRPSQAPRLAVILPKYEGEPPLVAIPLVLTMGWVDSPPTFCCLTETVCDTANARAYRRYAAPHRLESKAACQDEQPSTRAGHHHRFSGTKQSPARELPATEPGGATVATDSPLSEPLAYFDIFVDDFLVLAQGGHRKLQVLRRILMHALDEVLEGPHTGQAHMPEALSLKKLSKGEGSWKTRQTILGWVIDTARKTLELPDHRKDRVLALFDSLRDKKRVSTKKWMKALGELRFISPGVPGSAGLFSPLQLGLTKADKHRVRVTSHIRRHLTEFEDLVRDLTQRPTHLSEIIPDQPRLIGATDACQEGMGGVLFSANHPPLLWRARFPDDIQRNMVTWENPLGTLTNSDFEQAGVIAQHMLAAQTYQVQGRTLATLTDNTPTVSRFNKASVTSDQAAAYLCRLSSLHQRHQRYVAEVSYIPGPVNSMADDCSRLWHLNDQQLLTHFNFHYPQSKTWQLCHLSSEVLSSLESALRKTTLASATLPPPGQLKIAPFPSGALTCKNTTCQSTFKGSTSPSDSSRLSQLPTDWEKSPATASSLAQWRKPCRPLERRSNGWLTSTPTLASTIEEASSGNSEPSSRPGNPLIPQPNEQPPATSPLSAMPSLMEPSCGPTTKSASKSLEISPSWPSSSCSGQANMPRHPQTPRKNPDPPPSVSAT